MSIVNYTAILRRENEMDIFCVYVWALHSNHHIVCMQCSDVYAKL